MDLTAALYFCISSLLNDNHRECCIIYLRKLTKSTEFQSCNLLSLSMIKHIIVQNFSCIVCFPGSWVAPL